jgi:hypothetical protein
MEHLMTHKHGFLWHEDFKQKFLAMKQNGQHLADFVHTVTTTLRDIKEINSIGLPATDLEIVNKVFYMLDAPLQDALREHLHEFKTVRDIVQKATVKGLHGPRRDKGTALSSGSGPSGSMSRANTHARTARTEEEAYIPNAQEQRAFWAKYSSRLDGTDVVYEGEPPDVFYDED